MDVIHFFCVFQFTFSTHTVTVAVTLTHGHPKEIFTPGLKFCATPQKMLHKESIKKQNNATQQAGKLIPGKLPQSNMTREERMLTDSLTEDKAMSSTQTDNNYVSRR